MTGADGWCMPRCGLHCLSIAAVSGLMACAQSDATSPASDLPTTCTAPCLQPWLASPTWALSDLRGELLFSSTDTLYGVVASHFAAPRKIMQFPYRPIAVHLSPDGTRAATLHVDGSSGFLCVIDGGVVGTRRCVPNSSPGSTALAWTPDGQALVHAGRTHPHGETARLSIVDPVTLEFRTLLNGREAQSVSFTPDGSTVSYTEADRLWRMPMSGGVPQLQPGFEKVWNLRAARWSPDGKSIALLSWNGDDQTLSVANADGSNLRMLLRLPVVSNPYCLALDHPVWSPDGEWLGLSLFDCRIEPLAERTVVVSSGGKGARIVWNLQGLVHDWR